MKDLGDRSSVKTRPTGQSGLKEKDRHKKTRIRPLLMVVIGTLQVETGKVSRVTHGMTLDFLIGVPFLSITNVSFTSSCSVF